MAVWISHLKVEDEADGVTCSRARAGAGCELCNAELCPVAGIKLPAAQALAPLLRGVPGIRLPIDAPADHRTFREIVYTEDDEVGYLSFDFYNGAMSTSTPRRVPPRPLSPDQGHRSARWRRFLVERHQFQCDRGERRSGHGVLTEHRCD